MTPLAPLLSGLLAVQAPAGAVAVCKPTDNACNAQLYEQRAAQTTDPIRRAKYLVAAAASHLGDYDGSHEVRSLCAAWRAHAQSAAILGEEHPGAAALRRELAARDARPKCTQAGSRKPRAALASAERPRQQPPSNQPASPLAPAERSAEDSTSSPAADPQAAPAEPPVAARTSEADRPSLLSVPTGGREGAPSPRPPAPRGDASSVKDRVVAPPSPRTDDPRPGRGLVLAGGVTLGVGVALAAAAGSMGRRMGIFAYALLLGLFPACPPLPEFVTCEDATACGTTGPTSAGPDDGTPTTSDGTPTEMSGDAGSTSAPPPGEESTSAGETTDPLAEPPAIVTAAVIPDYTASNAVLLVEVTAKNSKNVEMQLDDGTKVALTPLGGEDFRGQIYAYSGLLNGQHTATFLPSRNELIGAAVGVDYVIALPPPGYELYWQTGGNLPGQSVAVALLPDGRPVELLSVIENGAPRCYLGLRDAKGEPLEFAPVLQDLDCWATDLTIDPTTGLMKVLVDRMSGDGKVWSVRESEGWGSPFKTRATGEPDETAFALASRPGLDAVCGRKTVATDDGTDGYLSLLEGNLPPEDHAFDYRSPSDPQNLPHQFGETFRDCAFAPDGKLVLAGSAHGRHELMLPFLRERLALLEYDPAIGEDEWVVAGPMPDVQSRATAIDVDPLGRRHLVGIVCADLCEPEGAVWQYEPDGEFVSHASLGPLESDLLGPHALAWSVAGYVVVALARREGLFLVFTVHALFPGEDVPAWTFTAKSPLGDQIALALALGRLGEVWAAGVGAGNTPAFARIGG